MVKQQKLVLGGQAVIEGVMIKSEHNLAIAVRLPNGKIKTKKQRIGKFIEKHPWLKFPFIRGITNLIQILVIGIKALYHSANEQVEEKEKLTTTNVILSLLIALFFAFLLFKLIPLGITKILYTYKVIGGNRFVFNLIDGLIRITIFLLYIFIISLMKEVRVLFQYHGAEHKAVHCYEAKRKLTVENVKRYSTLHQRCGTSFLLLVLFIAVLIFSLVPVKLPFYLLLMYRLPLILPIASIAYELLKLSAKYPKNPLLKLLIKPGLWLQKITTKEPDNRQIEVAITALGTIISLEKPKNQRKFYI